MSTIYINTPFPRCEHDAIASSAKRNGRSKGQELRFLALKALGLSASAAVTTANEAGASAVPVAASSNPGGRGGADN